MTQKRTLSDIEQEMFDVQERIYALNNELRELKDKLHSLKEEKFEVANCINKGDIIDIDGVKYYYRGLSDEYCDFFMLVSKITKKDLPSKNTMYLSCSKLNKDKK